jgi:hypothetical protein
MSLEWNVYHFEAAAFEDPVALLADIAERAQKVAPVEYLARSARFISHFQRFVRRDCIGYGFQAAPPTPAAVNDCRALQAKGSAKSRLKAVVSQRGNRNLEKLSAIAECLPQFQ